MNKPAGFYSKLYVMWVVVAFVFVAVASFALAAFAPGLLSGGGSGMGAVTVVVPPMLAAQSFYKHEQRRMTGREGWLFAVWFTVLAFAVSVVVLWVMVIVRPLNIQEMPDLHAILGDGTTIVLSVLGVFAVLLTLLNRLMIWSGIRGAIKQEEKLTAKAARKG